MVEAQVPHARRRAFWDWVFGDAPRDLAAQGALDQAAKAIKTARATPDASPP